MANPVKQGLIYSSYWIFPSDLAQTVELKGVNNFVEKLCNLL
jgi:hypothetical protein